MINFFKRERSLYVFNGCWPLCLQMELIIATYKKSSKLWCATMNKLAQGTLHCMFIDDDVWYALYITFSAYSDKAQ